MLIENFLYVTYYVSEVTSAGGDATIERSACLAVSGGHIYPYAVIELRAHKLSQY